MKLKRVYNFVVATFAAALLVSLAILAGAGQSQAGAQAVAQGYIADSPLQAGMIVRLADDKSKVRPLTQDEGGKMHGVVVRPNDAPLALSETTAGQQVYVATSGNYQVLVSNQNGPVKQGDLIVVSSIEGIGMRVNNSAEFIVGKAVSSFDGKNDVMSQTTIKNSLGVERTIKIGYVKADINIGENPMRRGTTSGVPVVLQNAADAIANKPVSAIRIYLGLTIAAITSIAVCTLLYAGIRTSIVSLGRNPLARDTILRNMIRVVLLGLTILIVGVGIVYLCLRI